ncbi:hypothetical protein LQ567_16305 [Niabella pedocola]|uniref:Uncharacterized protein n=1 Tax=Niabella pedocola TaxID=1752077 RepID=A0ABS8PVN5_9BACT|nr:hypothetical protein [Niabella pedocola]MCD2424343.1 hypothetical protein [Niabella pedocola]
MEEKIKTEEKESVLFVLNEFSERYQENNKNIAALTGEVKEQHGKIQQVIENQQQQKLTENNTAVIVQKEAERFERIISKQNFPAKEIEALRRELSAVRERLAEPLIQKLEHYHHVHKIIIATGVLFIAVCLLCCGWYNTFQRLGQFQENDTKYRLIRLDTALVPMQRYLDKVDQIYTCNPKLRDSVIAQEKENKRNMERLEKAYRMNQEAEKLRSGVKQRQKSVGTNK